MADEPIYAQTSEQVDMQRRLDLEEALEKGEDGVPDGTARSFSVQGNDVAGYIGTDPIYQGYASDTNKPLVGEGDRADVVFETSLRELSDDPAQTINETRSDVTGEGKSSDPGASSTTSDNQ